MTMFHVDTAVLEVSQPEFYRIVYAVTVGKTRQYPLLSNQARPQTSAAAWQRASTVST